MTKRIWLTIIASMLFAAAIACPAIAETTAAKKKKPTPTSTATRTPTPTPTPAPQVWISTTGIVATGSSKSHADAPSSEAANSSVVVPSALAESIPNEGCPTAMLPGGSGNVGFGGGPVIPGDETVVTQGTMSAPAGTTSMWEATAQHTVVFGSPVGANQLITLNGYIGKAADGCLDFASCSPSLTKTPLITMAVNAASGQIPATIFQDFTELQSGDTAVFFVTATVQNNSGVPPENGSCVSGSIYPLAHSQ